MRANTVNCIHRLSNPLKLFTYYLSLLSLLSIYVLRTTTSVLFITKHDSMKKNHLECAKNWLIFVLFSPHYLLKTPFQKTNYITNLTTVLFRLFVPLVKPGLDPPTPLLPILTNKTTNFAQKTQTQIFFKPKCTNNAARSAGWCWWWWRVRTT